ncbi:MAG: type II toxin-antitoxin system Phd/YefM family antitoxin [Candidatus Saccharimonadales bacterium]
MAKTENFVSLKELRAQFPKYIERLGKGQSFTVLKRSKPIFQLTPVADEGEWATIADFTTINSGGVPANELLKHL